MFRWDKTIEGALYSGLVTLVMSAAPFFADGKITGAEGIMMLGTFLGGIALYIKTHPPVEGEEEKK